MQQYKVQSASDLSRHTFKNLVAMWFTIMVLTFAAALFMSVGLAKADFTSPSPPTPTVVQEQSLSHIHPQKAGIAQSDISGRTQRNAEPQGL